MWCLADKVSTYPRDILSNPTRYWAGWRFCGFTRLAPWDPVFAPTANACLHNPGSCGAYKTL
jgi:hypothetical protein